MAEKWWKNGGEVVEKWWISGGKVVEKSPINNTQITIVQTHKQHTMVDSTQSTVSLEKKHGTQVPHPQN